jgi:hypothetical protein
MLGGAGACRAEECAAVVPECAIVSDRLTK